MARPLGPSSVGNTKAVPKTATNVRRRSTSLDHVASPSHVHSNPKWKTAPVLPEHSSTNSRSRGLHNSNGNSGHAQAKKRDSHGRHGGGDIISSVRTSRDLLPYSPDDSRQTSETGSGGSAEYVGSAGSSTNDSSAPYQFKPTRGRGVAGRAGTSLDDVTVLEGKGTAVLLPKNGLESDTGRAASRLSPGTKKGATSPAVGFSNTVKTGVAAPTSTKWVEVDTSHLDSLSVSEVFALVKLEERIRRVKARILKKRKIPEPWKKRTKRAAARFYAWAADLHVAQELERVEMGFAVGDAAIPKGNGAAARKMRRQSMTWQAQAALAAKHRVDDLIARILFAAWVIAFIWVLLWMLQVFPNMNGYPIETWTPTRCSRKEYAAANPVLCGVESE